MRELNQTCWLKIRRKTFPFTKGKGCWQWQAASGRCSKGDHCSFRHERNKRAKIATRPTPYPEPSALTQGVENLEGSTIPRGRSPSRKISRQPCKLHFQSICANPCCEKWHFPECMFYKAHEGCKFWDKCSFAHLWVEEQPSKRFEKNCDQNALATLKETKNSGCVFQDMEPPKFSSFCTEELNHAVTYLICSIHQSRIARTQYQRPKSIAQQNLPRGSSSAQPQRSNFGGSVSGGEWHEHWAHEAA